MRFVLVPLVLLSFALAGCSGTLSDSRRIDYKSAGKLPPLDIPPDLAAPQTDERYSIPEAGGVATFSAYSRDRGARPGETRAVLPEAERVRVERAGTQRWLVVAAAPEAVWPLLREFWQDNGFLIARETPEIGVMETDWAENRARIPQSGIRRVLGTVLDNVYSYPERDKFRTRVERGTEPGTTEVFISHRGMYEVVVGERQSERTMWQARPADPELEAEMLYRLMARLGANDAQVQAVQRAPQPEPRATVARSSVRGSSLYIEDPFDRAWRRVGLALDRVGFTVEDRDRSKGVYYVRYADPEVDRRRTGLARLAFWRRTPGPTDEQFRISVQDAAEERSEVKVLDASGEVAQGETADRILGLLQEQLK